MDEGRKRVLWICAAILAAPRLTDLEDGKNDAAQAHIRQDAIQKAKRIMRQIDAQTLLEYNFLHVCETAYRGAGRIPLSGIS
jgi:hypothetical protein